MRRVAGSRYLIVMVAVLAVVASLSAALVGCGDDPYTAAAKDIVREFSETGDAIQATAEAASARQQDTAGGGTVIVDIMRQAVTDLSAAVTKAQSGLRGLTPPTAAAQAFQTQYLEGLADYAAQLQALADVMDYLVAGLTALEGVLPEEAESGVWADIVGLTESGMNTDNVAQLAPLLAAAHTLLVDGAQRWDAVKPLEGLEAFHEPVSADLQKLITTFDQMAQAAAAGVSSGSDSKLGALAPLWELAADQWDTLLGDLDAWLNKTNALGDSITALLDDLQGTLKDLAKSL